MRFSKFFLLTMIIVSVFLNFEKIQACSFEEECYQCSRFVVDTLFRNPKEMYRKAYNFLSDVEDQNQMEWENYFSQKIKMANMKELTADLNRLDQALMSIKDKKFQWNNSELKPLNEPVLRQKLIKFLYYYGYALRVDQIVNGKESHENNEASPTDLNAVVNDKIAGGLKLFQQAQDPLLRERYLYQMMRLHFYFKDSQALEGFFNQYKSQFTIKSSSYYRSLAYVYGKSDLARANYGFSYLFDQAPYMRTLAMTSFRPQNETDWQDVLKLTQNPHEKEVIYYMLGLQYDRYEAIKKLKELNINSSYISILFYNELAAYQLPSRFQADESNQFITQKESYKKMQSLVRQIAQDSQLKDRFNAKVTELFFSLFNFEKDNITRLRKELSSLAKSKEQLFQLRLINIYLSVLIDFKQTADFENKIAPDLLWLMKIQDQQIAQNYLNFVKDVLSLHYLEKGELLKATLLSDQIYSDINTKRYSHKRSYFSNLSKVEMLNSFLLKKNKTEFEKFLFLAFIGRSKESLVLADVQNLKSILQLKRGLLTEFLNHASNDLLKLKIIDPYEPPVREVLNKYYFSDNELPANTMTLKQAVLKVNSATVSQQKYLLGNLLYSLSYEGINRNLDTHVSSFLNLVYNLEQDMKVVQEIYKEALVANSDREIKARIVFQLAKVDRNLNYTQTAFDQSYGYIATQDVGYFSPYLLQLKQDYSDTEFLKEAINECTYLK